ncbi:MAG TPA: hypothetical protein VL132_00780 [Planctomycetaceae bacterium]|nr:hypothetical protein [Planctomycetaceae bacterium]
MVLTAEQIAAVNDGVSVTVADAETGVEFVVVRADLYARIRRFVEDRSDEEIQATASQINEIMQDDDALDPWLESYQTP